MATSTARHARETAAIVALAGGTNREYLRQSRRVMGAFVDAKDAILSGEVGLSDAYALATGDRRVAIYVKVAPEVRERIRILANENGLTMAEVIEQAVTQIFG